MIDFSRIEAESDLLHGDVAVYATPDDMVPRLCLRVRAGERQDRMHEAVESSMAHGRLRDRPRMLGSREHFGRVVLEVASDYYVPAPENNVFLYGVRFFDAKGKRRKATYTQLCDVMERALVR